MKTNGIELRVQTPMGKLTLLRRADRLNSCRLNRGRVAGDRSQFLP